MKRRIEKELGIMRMPEEDFLEEIRHDKNARMKSPCKNEVPSCKNEVLLHKKLSSPAKSWLPNCLEKGLIYRFVEK